MKFDSNKPESRYESFEIDENFTDDSRNVVDDAEPDDPEIVELD